MFEKKPNVGLEATALVLGVRCSSDRSSQSVLRLPIFDGIQWAFVLVMLHYYLSFTAVLQCSSVLRTFEKFSTRNHNPGTQCLVPPSLPAVVHSRCIYLMVFIVRVCFQMVCSYLHFKFFLYSELLFKGIAQLGSLDHSPWIKRLLHYRLIRWALETLRLDVVIQCTCL